MPKGAKVAGVAVILIIALAAAAPLLLKRFLPPERVRALVVAQAQKSLGREVRLAAVSYSLKGLSLEQLAISERPDFKAGTFIAVKRFHVRAALLPLLKKSLVVDRVEADGLRLRVVKRADGSFNFSDLTKPSGDGPAPGAPASEPSTAGPGFALGVRSAAISDGRLEYLDQGAGEELAIFDLALKAKGIRLSGPFEAEASARAQGRYGGAQISGAAALAGRLDLGGRDPRKFQADLRKVSLEHAGYAVKGALKVEGLDEVFVRADLKASRDARALGALEWEGKGRRRPGVGLGVELEGKLALKTQAMRGGDLSALGGPAMGLIPPLRATGEIALKGSELTARGLQLETPVGRVTLDGGAHGLGTPAFEPRFAAALALDLPEIHASQLPAGMMPKGLVLPPMSLAGRVKVKGDSAVFEKVRAQLKQGTIEVSGAAAGLRSGKPRVDVEISAKLDVPQLYASDLAFMTVPKGFVSPAFVVEGKARVKGDDAQIEALRLRAQAGSIDLSGWIRGLSSGPEPALDVVAKLALPAFKAADAPFLPLAQGFAMPPSRWDVDLTASRDEARFRTFRAVVGSTDLEIEKGGRVSGLRSSKPLADLTIKCRQFVLEELADLTPAIRELALRGSGFFALSASGPLDKPILAGKLQFRTLAASIAGLKLEGFTGTVSFDEKRIDVPNLRGRVEGGELKLDLTVRNYAAKPDVDLEASLTEFDLGKLFAANVQLAASRDAGAQAKGKPKPSQRPAQPMDLKGKLTVGRLFHPNFEARDLRSSWQLSDYTPDYRKLGGWAKFTAAGGGHLKDLGKASTQNKLVKILLLPLAVIQKLGGLLGRQVFPNYDDVSYTELIGDYAFSSGVMRLNESRLNADVGDVSAAGVIDLPAEKLDMTVSARVGNVPIDVSVGGTFDQPKTRVKLEKILAEPAKQLIEGLFKKR